MEEKNNRDSIYKKYYEKLNEALNIEDALNSYNKYQQEKNKNQMIQPPFSKVSSISNNNDFENQKIFLYQILTKKKIKN